MDLVTDCPGSFKSIDAYKPENKHFWFRNLFDKPVNVYFEMCLEKENECD